MDGFGAGYFVGRRKEHRRNVRDRAAQRDQMEREIRAQYGLPPLPAHQYPGHRPIAPGRPWVTARGVRRLALACVLLVVLMALLLAIALIGYGIQHHLIYMAPSR